jgi:hypothetical protein
MFLLSVCCCCCRHRYRRLCRHRFRCLCPRIRRCCRCRRRCRYCCWCYVVAVTVVQWRKSWWGRGGGVRPPPHLPENWRIFGNFDLKEGWKQSFRVQMGGGGGGGGVCRKFESFVGNLGGFAPAPEKVNFRHCCWWCGVVVVAVACCCYCQGC